MSALILAVALLAVPAAGGADERQGATSRPAGVTYVADEELLNELKDCPQTTVQRVEKLVALFEQAGVKDVKLQKFDAGPLKGRQNVIATLPGQEADVIVVGAHVDFKPVGKGVVDNWSGAALMANLAQTLAQRKNTHTFVFVGFDMEELGLHGSRHYVAKLSEKERKRICAMVNLDCLGVSGMRFWPTNSADDLEAVAEKVAQQGTFKVQREEFKGATADARAFLAAGIPAITFLGLGKSDLRVVHSAKDRFEAIDRKQYSQAYRYLTAFLLALDGHQAKLTAANREDESRPKFGFLIERQKFDEGESVVVCLVVTGGPEEKAGMKEGDQIVEFAGVKVDKLEDFTKAALALKPRQKVVVKVKRVQETISLTVQY